jgi:predicted P-loop ATPase
VGESLDEVAAVELDRELRAALPVLEAVLERDGVDLEPGLGADRHRLRADVQDGIGVHAGVDESMADEPQRLPKGPDRGAVGVRPEVRRDRLACSRSTRQDEQCEQGRRVAPPEPHRGATDRPDVEAPEQVDAKDRVLDRIVSPHDIPRS